MPAALAETFKRLAPNLEKHVFISSNLVLDVDAGKAGYSNQFTAPAPLGPFGDSAKGKVAKLEALVAAAARGAPRPTEQPTEQANKEPKDSRTGHYQVLLAEHLMKDIFQAEAPTEGQESSQFGASC